MMGPQTTPVRTTNGDTDASIESQTPTDLFPVFRTVLVW